MPHDKINVEAQFDGKIEFICFDLVGAKKTPTIKVRCIADNDRESSGDLWCSKMTLSRTIELLKSLGVQGNNNQQVLENAETELTGARITFETEENDGYYNATKIRPQGEEFSGGGGRGVATNAFVAAVFGAATTTETMREPGDDDLDF